MDSIIFFCILIWLIVTIIYFIDKYLSGKNDKDDKYDRSDSKTKYSEIIGQTAQSCEEPEKEKEQPLNDEENELDKLTKRPDNSMSGVGRYLLFDTETTGLPRKSHSVPEDFSNWPYIVDIAWYLIDENGLLVESCRYIVRQKVSIPKEASDIHHITTQKMLEEGTDPKEVYASFIAAVQKAEYVIAHNIAFDLPIVECELLRNGFDKILSSKKQFCTMKSGREFCTVYDKGGRLKYPKLEELFSQLYFGNPYNTIEGTHTALFDTLLLYRCFIKMKKLKPSLLKNCERAIYIEDYSEREPLSKYPTSSRLSCLDNNILFETFSNGFERKEVLVTGVPNEDKEYYWDLIIGLNGKVVKSVTKKLEVVVMGATPGWKKMANIEAKVDAGEKIICITDLQLEQLSKNKL